MTGLTIGVVGATGVVGETALEILTDQDLMSGVPVATIKAFASSGSAGKVVQHGGHRLTVEVLNEASGAACDVLFFATDGGISREQIPVFADKGVLCIDKSSAFRMDAGVPLIVPEVNGHLLEDDNWIKRPIVANPNCCTAPLTVALNPLKKAFGLRRAIVSTYQSVSGAGKQAIDVLLDESRRFLQSEDLSPDALSTVFPKPIAFNVFPFVASIGPKGHTDEEEKIIEETRKILALPDLPLAATSVRVPTFVSHCEAVTVELARETSVDEIASLLAQSPGICLSADTRASPDDERPLLFPTPREAHGKDPVFVGRIRAVEAFQAGYGFSLWVVADNLRKGAALNGVQVLKHAVAIGALDRLRASRGIR
jgi:aspartate-semialdehyde dehydrogenase